MTNIWQQYLTLEILNKRNANTMAQYLGIVFVEITDTTLNATMPVDRRTHQPLGIMNGGASCVLAETVASAGANFCVDQTIHYCVGLDINTNHIRSVREGLVTAIAEPIHLGGSTQVWGIKIYDPDKRLVSISRLTLAVLSRKH